MTTSLEKAFHILSHLATKPKAGPSNISRDLKYSKSTVIRLLQAMEKIEIVRQDQTTGQYELGYKVLELAQGFLGEQDNLVATAVDQVQALWEKFSETVSLFVREGDRRICVYRQESPFMLRHSIRVGQILPLHLGASGKCFLAYMPPEETDLLFAQWNLSPDSYQALHEDLAGIRVKGVAFGEREPGDASISAPILNARGCPVLVLTISGPAQRFTPDRIEQVAGSLKAAAQTISSRIVGQ
jgi:IclR family KDG regulon transcriptional repressor